MYSMIVSMNKMGLPASGGGMAGPVFRAILEQMVIHGMPTLFVVDEERNDTTMVDEEYLDSIKNIHNE
jgi:hypothetical protein